MNEPHSKIQNQGLYPSRATVVVGDLIINGLIEERINTKNRSFEVYNFPGTAVADMELYLVSII